MRVSDRNPVEHGLSKGDLLSSVAGCWLLFSLCLFPYDPCMVYLYLHVDFWVNR